MKRRLYEALASLQLARRNAFEAGNHEWVAKHRDRAHALVKEHMPSGSGIDRGCTLIGTDHNKLVFQVDFHHMDEHGGYDGWTEHTVTVWPSLAFGINIKISGPDRNQIKDYLGEVLDAALRAEVEDVS